MNYVKVHAYAKINLTLDILGKQGGYHMLDSVVTTIDISDVITVRKRNKDKLVSVEMHGMGSETLPYESNNAVKAAERFIEKYSTCGVDVTVWKNIPMGAGLGGSSADVAGVLNAMKALFSIDDGDGVKRIADGIGSDCGYMLYGGYARLGGRGERVKLIDSKMKLDLALLLPKTSVSTAQCYALCDGVAERRFTSGEAALAIEAGDANALGKALSNGLYSSACALNGDVARAYGELAAFDPLGVNMTGSGSCVYALFENDQFARYAQSRYRGKYDFILTKTHIPKIKREDN